MGAQLAAHRVPATQLLRGSYRTSSTCRGTPIDLWTYDHAARLNHADTLDDELARGAEYAADAFEEHGRARLEPVVQDVADRGLGDVPALVEGLQLSPALAESLPGGFGVWLVPDSVRTRRTAPDGLFRIGGRLGVGDVTSLIGWLMARPA